MDNKIQVWFAKNKNEHLVMFTSEPIREGEKWVGDYYLNSVVYNVLSQMLEKTPYSFDDDAQYIEFTNPDINEEIN